MTPRPEDVQALLGRTVHELAERVVALEAGIRTHRDQRGDDRCWLDDVALYALLADTPPAAGSPRPPMPPREKFLANCSRYYDARCRDAGWPSYQELEADLADEEQLRDRLTSLLKRTAIALKGPEPPLVMWDWSDIPEKVGQLVEALRQTTNHLAAGIRETGGSAGPDPQPPEPADEWSEAAIVHVVANRALLPPTSLPVVDPPDAELGGEG